MSSQRDLSSGVATFAYRVFLPTVASGMITAFIAGPHGSWTLGIALFAVTLLGALAVSGEVLKTVALEDDALVIASYFKSIRVPFDQIDAVRLSRFNPETIVITFNQATAFGTTVRFIPMPRVFPGLSLHPTFIELERIVSLRAKERS